MNVEHLDPTTFETTIATGVTLVDFWATWCGPCKMQGAILDKMELPASLVGKVTVGKLDIDKAPMIAAKYRVQSIPTIIIYKDGAPIETLIGVTRADALIEKLEKAIA